MIFYEIIVPEKCCESGVCSGFYCYGLCEIFIKLLWFICEIYLTFRFYLDLFLIDVGLEIVVLIMFLRRKYEGDFMIYLRF